MRKALIIAAATLMGCGSPALADPAQTWEAGYLVLDAADAAETINCLHHHTCTEGNPLFGKHPSAFKLIAGKLALGALQFTIFQRMHERDPHAALRYAQVNAHVTLDERITAAKKCSPFLSTKQAAFYLGVSPRLMQIWRHDRIGPTPRRHGRFIRYHIDDLDNWSEGRRV